MPSLFSLYKGTPNTYVGADELTKVSITDTESDYLENKLVEGSGITLIKNNNAGVETLTISSTSTGLPNFQVNVETLSGTKTLVSDSPYYQYLNPGGVDRVVVLDPAWQGEISNESDGVFELALYDGATQVLSLSASSGYQTTRVIWDGTRYIFNIFSTVFN